MHLRGASDRNRRSLALAPSASGPGGPSRAAPGNGCRRSPGSAPAPGFDPCRRVRRSGPGTVMAPSPHALPWSQRQESNPQPTDYKSVALPLSHAGASSRILDADLVRKLVAHRVASPSAERTGVGLAWAGSRLIGEATTGPGQNRLQSAHEHRSVQHSEQLESREIHKLSTVYLRSDTPEGVYCRRVIDTMPQGGVLFSCLRTRSGKNRPLFAGIDRLGMWHSGNCGGL